MSFTNLLQSLNSTCYLTLQQKINTFIQNNIRCRGIFIVSVSNTANEGIVNVVGETVLQEEFRFSVPNQFDLKSANFVEWQTEGLDHDFESKFKLILDPYPKNLLRVPISHPDRDGQITFFVFVMDPIYNTEKTEYNYSAYIKHCFGSCSAILLNAFNTREEKKMKELQKKLLLIAKSHLLHIGDYNELLLNILIEARNMINAERCSLFLFNQDRSHLVAKIFDGVLSEQAKEIQIPVTCGIIGYVAVNGETVNVHDAQNHPLFYKSLDESSGFKTRNLLCFPVRNDANNIVAVVEISNKRNGYDFTSFDEEAAAAFGIFFGIALMHSIVHRKIQTVKAQDRLSAELVLYHLTKNHDDFSNILNCKEKHKYQDMLNYQWLCREVNFSDSVCYVIKMFENLGITKTWKISKKTLVLFVLTVRKGYRDLPYHNWAHAFSVAHLAYLLMLDLNLMQKCAITKLEGTAFLVSALCHDLDHRGTTNSFQIISDNSLANLYRNEGSVLERHHFSQTLAILNTPNCNIFENLSVHQYVRVLGLIRDMIVATDMLQHMKVLPDEKKMSIEGYNPGKKSHRSLLLSLMMTCCDLNDQLKGWLYCRDIAEMIYTEFFLQGDMEKEMGRIPLEMMDREKAFIPRLQLEFLKGICIPCFTVLCNIFPSLEMYVSEIEDTATRWLRAIKWFKDNNVPENSSIDRIFDPALERYVLEGSRLRSVDDLIFIPEGSERLQKQIDQLYEGLMINLTKRFKYNNMTRQDVTQSQETTLDTVIRLLNIATGNGLKIVRKNFCQSSFASLQITDHAMASTQRMQFRQSLESYQ